VHAQEFRALRPIATPAVAPPPTGARPAASFVPVDHHAVEEATRGIFAKWNTPEFESTLAETFFDRTRLQDALETAVPRDARLRLLSVQGVQTLEQQVLSDATGLPINTVVSTVSATVRLQAEFNDPFRGFQTREGVNELILRVTERTLR
jgi:hypothetical protein